MSYFGMLHYYTMRKVCEELKCGDCIRFNFDKIIKAKRYEECLTLQRSFKRPKYEVIPLEDRTPKNKEFLELRHFK